MVRRDRDNIVPLIEAAVAHRDRLVERANQSDVGDFVTLRNGARRIDRWLTDFAYRRVVPRHWAHGGPEDAA